jgi:hypothetical protein
MNSQFVLIVMLVTNFFILYYSALLPVNVLIFPDAGQTFLNNYFDFADITNVSANSELQISQGMNTSVTALITPNQNPISQVVQFLTDGLLMIISIVSLFTPFPIMSVFYTLGLPIYVYVPVVITTFITWVWSLMEFVRGSKWGGA